MTKLWTAHIRCRVHTNELLLGAVPVERRQRRETPSRGCTSVSADLKAPSKQFEVASPHIEHTNVTVNSFHPGMVGSDFAKNNGWVAQVAMTLIKPIARSPLKGAETGIYLCTSPEVAR